MSEAKKCARCGRYVPAARRETSEYCNPTCERLHAEEQAAR